MKIGHNYEKKMSVFTVWSNKNKSLKIEFPDSGELFAMTNIGNGYYEYRCDRLDKGTKYKFVLENGTVFPDPVSKSQPDGVHSYSAIDSTVNLSKPSNFKGVDLRDAIIYELHFGTFTQEGTISAAANMIPYLKELGINTVSVMPLAAFPGEYNWGYDGVFQFAIDSTYGTISDFIEFINSCNKEGIAVILDIVYNHFGPEGNYLSQYASYFTKRFHTPWGQAISFDGRYSKHVKNFFMENIKFWLEDIKVDGFRVDSPAHIYDYSDKHILEMIMEYARELEQKEERVINIISEHPSHLFKSKHNIDIDAHWQDDFHHFFHVYFTDDKDIFTGDYGEFEQLKMLFKLGYCTEYWKTTHYNDPYRLLSFIQSHDQIGNRPDGGRISTLIDYEQYKLSVFALFVSPFTPMLFMGEEYYETNPFYYFCDFGDNRIRKGVRNGRKKEQKNKYGVKTFIDPLEKETFEKSKLDLNKLDIDKHSNMLEFYKILIHLKKTKFIGSSNRTNISMNFYDDKKLMILENTKSKTLAVLNFSEQTQEHNLDDLHTIILSSDQRYDFKEFIIENKLQKINQLILEKYSFVLLKR